MVHGIKQGFEKALSIENTDTGLPVDDIMTNVEEGFERAQGLEPRNLESEIER